jgi:hypothetical protein
MKIPEWLNDQPDCASPAASSFAVLHIPHVPWASTDTDAAPSWRLLRPKGRRFPLLATLIRNGEWFAQHWAIMYDTAAIASPRSHSQTCDTFRPRRAVFGTARRAGLDRTAFVDLFEHRAVQFLSVGSE